MDFILGMGNGNDFKFGTELNQSLVSKMFDTIFKKIIKKKKKKDLIERAKVNNVKAILNKEKMDRSYCRHRVREVVGKYGRSRCSTGQGVLAFV